MNRPPKGLPDSQWDTEAVDTLHSVLANRNCRHTLYYLHSSSDSATSVEDLIDYIVSQDDTPDDRETIALHLSHLVLPKLEDVGYIDYQNQRDTVQYQGNALLDWYLNLITNTQSKDRCGC